MEHRWRQESPDADWKAVERGWLLSEKAFKEELLAQMHGHRKDCYGPELRKAELVHAERVLKERLRQRGWTQAELDCRRKGDPEKVEIANRLRAGTTLTLRLTCFPVRIGTLLLSLGMQRALSGAGVASERKSVQRGIVGADARTWTHGRTFQTAWCRSAKHTGSQ